MRQLVSSKKKSFNVGHFLLGHALIGILLYLTYRAAIFLLAQIEITPDFENIGFAVFSIAGTLALTGVLLRLDMRPIRKHIPVRRVYY